MDHSWGEIIDTFPENTKGSLWGQREPFCVLSQDARWRVTPENALFRRWSRREYFATAWLWLRLRFGCLLYFFLAFVFISHGKKFDTKAVPRKVRTSVTGYFASVCNFAAISI